MFLPADVFVTTPRTLAQELKHICTPHNRYGFRVYVLNIQYAVLYEIKLNTRETKVIIKTMRRSDMMTVRPVGKRMKLADQYERSYS
jgi:hypothetical protein